MANDYYKTLGIDKNANQEDIKKAYKNLAKKHHPDINKESGSAEKFKEINEAYSVLSDEQKRSNYDRFGDAGEQYSGFQGQQGFRGQGFDEDMFSDIFEEFFHATGFSGHDKRQMQGADLKSELEISFEESVFGAKKKISVTKLDKCEKCEGSGSEDEDYATCSTCNGTGMFKKQYRTPFGVISQTATCSTCNGEGQEIRKKCKECNGKGRLKKHKDITVTIPAGIDNGMTLKLAGEGEAGERGARNGNLYITVFAEKSKIFEREGNNLLIDIPISFAQATLGDEIEIPTAEGKVTMKIPEGTQSHTVFRLKGKGIQSLNGYGKGDELARVIVAIPTNLNKKQKELLENFAKENKEKVKIDKSILTKVRDALLS